MFKRQSLMAVGIALVLGLVAVYLANIFIDSGRGGAAPEGTTKVAVAAVPLEYGSALTRDNIRFIDYPALSLPAGAFRNTAELLPAGRPRVVLTSIAANEPILARKVTGAGQNASIAALLPDGRRAAAVRINDVSGVAGFIKPNDSVDVLITRQSPGENRNNAQMTDLLLQNVRVIAIDQEANNGDGKPSVAKTATLEVSPIEAQKLALGQQIGEIALVLRKPGTQNDNAFVDTVSLEDLRFGVSGRGRVAPLLVTTGQPAPRPRAFRPRPVAVNRPMAPRAEPRAAANNVEVVRGTAGTSYDVGGLGG
jgi:pilus assembly protein CpaB